MEVDVNLYVDSTIKAPRRGEGKAMYLLECIIKDEPKTMQGFIYLPDTTEDAAILTAMIEALGRCRETASVKIGKIKMFTTSSIFNAVDSGRIQGTRLKGFKNAKGQPAKNAELWDIFISMVGKHNWKITDERHSYSEYMRSELKKWHSQ